MIVPSVIISVRFLLSFIVLLFTVMCGF
uniref:Uncharacterized protein n=1 Tax=Anguilla anguilla TaxID=7936 RepID=A0A0E9VIB0_ANGAN